ncbi:putative membrane copper amine oxidase [Aspergillus steynii IBT 23096]|uniref:Amine oxidase n=1 Tax=Aspergillus steynii IBT 23096 TaxID=1392250 RepID=A0A2I2G7T7_9EURO|nr:putative membrane copper amine oxidase [Aspergillus steynii IBT 23096]PLB48938.1 putative membrane copper amine oxidase [Aspergillus steynii IBT 23096]
MRLPLRYLFLLWSVCIVLVQTRQDSPAPCPEHAAQEISAPKDNIWQDLSRQETASVVEWLHQQSELNLTGKDAGSWDNAIALVELLRPNKSDAVPYLDADDVVPPRFARVTLDTRATADAHFAEIQVGPLPIKQNVTRWMPLGFDWTRSTKGKVRNLYADAAALEEWVYNISATVADITLDLWNGTALGLENDTIDIFGFDPMWQDDDRIVRWDAFWNKPTDEFDAWSLLPLGLSFKSDVTGRDPSQWKLEGWLYNNIFYETTDAFRAAYYSPGFVKLPANVEGDWARTGQHGEPLPQDEKEPPVSVAPGGNRFSVDVEEQYVTWMDFSFYIAFSTHTGLSLFDIRYRGQRILYELGLQETLAHYAGIDPVQSGMTFLDSFFAFGPGSFELIKGFDCPSYATYLNTSFYVNETTHTHIDSLCLFEYNADHPFQHHTTVKYAGATRNVYFTLRSVATVGNYDYIFSYTFHLDGSIGIDVHLSGYIIGAFYAHNSEYGYQTHDALSGSMHDHVLNFKADLDIAGSANSVQLTSVVPVSKSYVWSDEPRNTMMLQRSFVANEDQSRLNWEPNSARQVFIVNKDAPNRYGELRGYQILPGHTSHLTVRDSSNLVNAARWAEYDVQITRQHDWEPRSTHWLNNQDVHDPPINFEHFFDGESLVQTDLVVWVNLGMHHIPDTRDLPNTVVTYSHSSVRFVPTNYFLLNPSQRTAQAVHISYGKEPATVESFGQTGDTCAVPTIEEQLASLYEYKGSE